MAKKAAKPKNEPSILRPMPPILIDLAALQDHWGAVWLENGHTAATKHHAKVVEKFNEKKEKGNNKGKEPEMPEPSSMGRFDKKQGMDFGGLLDVAFANALAEMIGGVPVMSPINNSLLPPDPNCVELGKTRVVGGIRPQNYDAAYRPDGPRVVYDSKTLNDTKSIGKNWQNMVNDLATEASTVHTRFPYCIVAFIVAMPRPALKGTVNRL